MFCTQYQNVFPEPDDEVVDADQPKKLRQCVNLLWREEEAADKDLWLMVMLKKFGLHIVVVANLFGRDTSG